MLNDVMSLLTSPVDLFQSVREKPRWLTPFLLVLVVSVVGGIITMEETNELARKAALESAPNEEARLQTEKYIEHPAVKVLTVVAPALFAIMSIFVTAAIVFLLLTLTGGMPGEKPYMGIVRVGFWAKLVAVPQIVIMVILTKLKGSAEIFLGPAAFMPADTADKLFRFAAGFDIFQVWFLAVFIVGLRICFGVSTGRASFAVLLPFFLFHAARFVLIQFTFA